MEEIGYQMAYSKQELRKVIKEYPGKEVILSVLCRSGVCLGCGQTEAEGVPFARWKRRRADPAYVPTPDLTYADRHNLSISHESINIPCVSLLCICFFPVGEKRPGTFEKASGEASVRRGEFVPSKSPNFVRSHFVRIWYLIR